MSECDRKQIIIEVYVPYLISTKLKISFVSRNILKVLHHDHMVRYHNRDVDRDVGMLYITMEYCGGGDLSTIIHQGGLRKIKEQ